MASRLQEVGCYILWNVVDAPRRNSLYTRSTKTNLTIEPGVGLEKTMEVLMILQLVSVKLSEFLE
jgi:hypothetical protein